MSFKNLEGLTAHWIQCLHNNADALSQWPCQEECNQCQKVEEWVDIKQIQTIAAVATTDWDPATLGREQENDQDIGAILD
jgi:predicted NAD-dependent protein-ADP-ribosyltransferase YbiA (DUF1768 family)